MKGDPERRGGIQNDSSGKAIKRPEHVQDDYRT